jgi:hypothetical protein
MPSVVIGQPVLSGAAVVISGNPWSGHFTPVGSIMFRWVSSGGNVYLALSGGGPPLSGNFMTINSGGFALSGGCLSGMLDGILIAPGDTYTIPKIALPTTGPSSGSINVFALNDNSSSGGRLYFESF